MSQLKSYDKELTPLRVKTKERGDVNIDTLVKHGAARIQQPTPVYLDLTDLPRSRGEAAARLNDLVQPHDTEFVKALLNLPPDQALQLIQSLRPPASNANDKTNAKEQGPTASPTPAGPGSAPAAPAAAAPAAQHS